MNQRHISALILIKIITIIINNKLLFINFFIYSAVFLTKLQSVSQKKKKELKNSNYRNEKQTDHKTTGNKMKLHKNINWQDWDDKT